MTTVEYLKHCYLVFCEKYAFWFFMVVTALAVFTQYFSFGVSWSDSLPYRLYLIDKTKTDLKNFKAGDYVAFTWVGGYYPEGTQFLKEIAGMPGSSVSRSGRDFFVDDKPVGHAKEFSQSGQPLAANPFTGNIPYPYVWVKGTHHDSLDSRYEISGLIHRGQFIGKAYPIF